MMNILRRGRHALLALLLVFGVNLAAHATYTNAFFFGDSLSDTGNHYDASNATFPPPPYYEGRYSNGPLWVEYLASGLGLAGTAISTSQGGNNYAIAGAKSGADGLADNIIGFQTGLSTQVDAYLNTYGQADPGALYVIAIGGNDLPDVLANPSVAYDGTAILAALQAIVGNLMSSVNTLINQGAHNFLITNAPNLGVTPSATAGGFAAAATGISLLYNNLLAAALGDLNASANIASLDLFGLITTVVDDALAGGGTYGLDNGLIECTVSGLDTCDRSVFFDDIHPSAAVHQLAGQAALAALGANQVPEPAGLSLLLAALVAAGIARRRPLATALA